jgi:hypothetical protein
LRDARPIKLLHKARHVGAQVGEQGWRVDKTPQGCCQGLIVFGGEQQAVFFMMD